MARRIVLLGNSGSGKTTLARHLCEEHGLVHLDLDSVAWALPGERLPLGESIAAMRGFAREHAAWVMEGSYASLAEAASPLASELIFLNPGVAACVAHCAARPWEPEKYASPEEQDERLAFLLGWVRSYPARTDEYGEAAHRAVYEAFDGPKREVKDGVLRGAVP